MHKEPIDFQISPNETNIIKGIAICAMLFHHLFYETNVYGSFTQQFAIVCKVCVSMFLFVSGYGMAVQYSKIDGHRIWDRIIKTFKFLLKRFSKFYLNYWVIFIILVPLGVFVLGRSLSIAYGTGYSIWYKLSKRLSWLSRSRFLYRNLVVQRPHHFALPAFSLPVLAYEAKVHRYRISITSGSMAKGIYRRKFLLRLLSLEF